jgi:hypothetical protein
MLSIMVFANVKNWSMVKVNPYEIYEYYRIQPITYVQIIINLMALLGIRGAGRKGVTNGARAS